MSRYEAVPHPRDPKLVYYRKVKDGGEPQDVPAKRPPRKSADGVVPAKRPKGEKRDVPFHRPAHPGKVVPVIRKKRNIQLMAFGRPPYDYEIYKTPTYEVSMMRGMDFPIDYYGFIDESYLEIETTADSGVAQLRLDFEEGRLKSDYFESTFDPNRGRIFTIEFFRNGRNRNLGLFDWPETIMPAECLDHTVIRPHPGSQIKIKNVRMILNGTVICQKRFSSPKKITNYQPLDLTSYIRETRLDHLREYTDSDNPILITAALEWGKAWNVMKYGGFWKKNVTGNWEERPVDWCSEFASWVISQATSLDPPFGAGDNAVMARYFIGRQKDSDLLNRNRFITPNKEICLWDDNESFDQLRFSIADKSVAAREWKEKRKAFYNERQIWLTYWNKNNSQQCSWANLPEIVKAGYYVKMKRGTRPDPPEKPKGHSTFFVKWQNGISAKPGFDKHSSFNWMICLGGNQDERVRVKRYSISKDDNGADILWKASRHAVGWGGYQDGFGITANLPFNIRSRRNREIQ
ncbi:MAG TPA: hypothetical protein PK961_07560 [bacterium]|nr:hypothetical protein [bacterium]